MNAERRTMRAKLCQEGAALGTKLAQGFIASYYRRGGTMDEEIPDREGKASAAVLAARADELRRAGVDGKSIKLFWAAAVKAHTAAVRAQRARDQIHGVA